MNHQEVKFMTKVLSKHLSKHNKMAESTVKDLLKYDKEPPEDPEKLLPWLLDINEEFFSQELARAVSKPSQINLVIYSSTFELFRV